MRCSGLQLSGELAVLNRGVFISKVLMYTLLFPPLQGTLTEVEHSMEGRTRSVSLSSNEIIFLNTLLQ